jgi:tetratricopeptide (TPR) repeat protein
MSLKESIYKLFGGKKPDHGVHPDLTARPACPDEADFLAYSERLVSDSKRAQLESHFVDCEDCREFLTLYAKISAEQVNHAVLSVEPLSEETVKQQTAAILTLIKQDEIERTNHQRVAAAVGGRGFYFPVFWKAVAAMVVLGVFAVPIYWMMKDPSPDDAAMKAIAMAMKDERRIEPRISGNFAYSPYFTTRGADDGDKLPLKRARDKMKHAENPTAPASEQLMLARAFLAGGERKDVQSALAILKNITDKGTRSPEALNDEGVALYVLGDFTEAIKYFTEALEKSPSFDEALFNRALANSRAHLDEEARRDWTEFLAKSSDENWKREARLYLERLGNSPAR